MNACPCGFYGDPTRECRCTPAIIQRYLGKISGPLLDRIDIQIEVPAVPYKELRGGEVTESSTDMLARAAGSRDSGGARLCQLADAHANDPQTVRSMTPASARVRWRCAG
jgi:magnesium chelatase family protein